MTVIELPLQTAARISFSTSLLEVNRKRAQRLMGILGIEALYPKPNLSRPAPGHEIYPYLLRGLSIERPNHVWSTDITYIPMRGGFLYLVAVMDWFSRYVLSWELSNTMETGFCLAAMEAAFRFGQPEIWNSDRGSQFTAADFLAPLKKRGAAYICTHLPRTASDCVQDRKRRACGNSARPGDDVGGCARLRRDVARGTAASNRDCGTAISEGCPDIPGGFPGQPRLSGGDNRRAAVSGMQVRCIPTAQVDMTSRR
jgi:hypothetical protein